MLKIQYYNFAAVSRNSVITENRLKPVDFSGRKG